MTKTRWTLTLTLVDAGKCQFEYESEALAREQYLMYQTIGVIGGYIIKKIELA